MYIFWKKNLIWGKLEIVSFAGDFIPTDRYQCFTISVSIPEISIS